MAGWTGAFTPLTPDRLARDLADWIVDLPQQHPRVGIDGAAEIGAGELADAVAARLTEFGRPALRTSTDWWWRPASLRLELGRTDIDMLLGGWVDAAALRRELLDPLGPAGSGSYYSLAGSADRPVGAGQPGGRGRPRAPCCWYGPFLLADRLPLDAVVHLQTTRPTLARALPANRQWWLDAFDRYRTDEQPADRAAAVIAYDHPKAPAIAWAVEQPEPATGDRCSPALTRCLLEQARWVTCQLWMRPLAFAWTGWMDLNPVLTPVLTPVRDLGDFIREQRMSAQISIRGLAAKAGVSNPYLSQVERGLRRPSAEILAQIAHGLSISVETLLAKAGILDAAVAPGVVAAVRADEVLTERQKSVLIDIYAAFRKEAAAAPAATKPIDASPEAAQPNDDPPPPPSPRAETSTWHPTDAGRSA